MTVSSLSQTAVAVCTALAWSLPVLAGWIGGHSLFRNRLMRLFATVIIASLLITPSLSWSELICGQFLEWIRTSCVTGIRFM